LTADVVKPSSPARFVAAPRECIDAHRIEREPVIGTIDVEQRRSFSM
jgi:hypothetical protein